MADTKKQQSTSTQQFVEINSIRDGVVVLKSGGLRRVLMVSGINFDLKSEEEQAMIIGAYQSFLNTLDFTLQFFIHSRKLNTEEYLEFLKERREKEDNELLRTQIDEYSEFIRSFVETNAIMEKAFFVAVPYDFISAAAVSAALPIPDFLKFWKTKSMEVEKKAASADLESKIRQINQRTDQVVGGLNQIGLRAVPLNTEEAIEFFYNLYNPESVEVKKLKIAEEY
ncbi:MAG: hypothetical protein HZA37_00235 [Parcubacteria group bacterium]|nr:hypothetical protein [Parcubacteria group bacterium]